MAERTIIHTTYDMETGKILKKYYTQNPIPEEEFFKVQHKGHILTFQIDHHFISDEKISLIKFINSEENS